MLPLINGKELISCAEDDFKVIVDNPDYRESEYIDYKLNFSFLECEKGREREQKKVEFKCDVCSFANADGGYLIYGVSDNNGCALSIEGIEIPDSNTDRFELARRNDLAGIQPKVPNVKFGFIPLKNGKYIVVIRIIRDSFAPYYYLEDEKNYRIYKRVGNGKKTISYNELKLMFNQSISLEKSVNDYVEGRINHYRFNDDLIGDQFVHIAIIPESFIDSNRKYNVFLLDRNKTVDFGSVFNSVNCNHISIPCVDGMRFVPECEDLDYAECYVKNSGIVEMSLSLVNHIGRNNFLPWEWLWKRINDICLRYINMFKTLSSSERCFVCLSLVGCKDVETDNDDYINDYIGRIDRDVIICDPIVLNMNSDNSEGYYLLKKLKLSFLLSIGVKYSKELNALINELYGKERQEE